MRAHGRWALVRPALLWLLAVAPAAQATDPAQQLYRQGVLPSGLTLKGTREGGADVEGRTAACASCHRRSGIGVAEGRVVIPPITGHYLFNPGERPVPEGQNSPLAAAAYNRVRYTDQTLARAIREGIGANGKPLSPLMPHYQLDDRTLAQLIAYLRTLSDRPAPGVEADTIHFATVVTPDADPEQARAMIEVLQHFFDNKDAYYRGKAPPLDSPRRIHFRVLRRWQLHVWKLSGAPDTWEAQLNSRLAAEPVMAVVSGMGGRSWAPVQAFCEHAQVPCLLPNVDLPVLHEGDFYSVYFSGGVLLEAALLRAGLPATVHHVIQVYRADDVGAAAAQTLSTELSQRSVSVSNYPLDPQARAPELAAALAHATPQDAVVLWLRGPDLALLPATAPTTTVFASGLMGGLERSPLPPEWLSRVHLTYPFDLPAMRHMRLTWALTWFKIQGIPVVDERLQVDSYLSCVILAEALGMTYGNFVRDYLVEQYENELSFRILTGYYPHLGLGPGQRFASKGGYLVHFAPGAAGTVVADGNWTVP